MTTNYDSPRKAPRVSIPAWAIGKAQDFADLVTAIALAGFDGQWIRLSADTQRALLGKAYFGKRAIRVSASTVEIFRVLCYGMDFEIETYNNATWNEAITRHWL